MRYSLTCLDHTLQIQPWRVDIGFISLKVNDTVFGFMAAASVPCGYPAIIISSAGF
jgi:hypothetical protein